MRSVSISIRWRAGAQMDRTVCTEISTEASSEAYTQNVLLGGTAWSLSIWSLLCNLYCNSISCSTSSPFSAWYCSLGQKEPRP